MTTPERGPTAAILELGSGISAVAREGGARLDLVGQDGTVQLTIRVGPDGIALELAATKLNIRADAVHVACEDLTVDAARTALRTGALDVSVDGAAAVTAGGSLALVAPLIDLN